MYNGAEDRAERKSKHIPNPFNRGGIKIIGEIIIEWMGMPIDSPYGK